MHENRETSETPAVKPDCRSAGEGLGRTARVHVSEESHSGVVPMNHSNKDTRPSAESGEGKAADQGERRSIQHVPDTEREGRVPRVGRRAESSKGTQRDEVHRLAPPSERRSTPGELLLTEEKSCAGSGRGNVAGV